MAAKVFEVGDVLPQRYITIYRDSSTDSPNISIKSDSDNFNFIYYSSPSWYYINEKRTFMYGISSKIVNLSSLSVERRTISSVSDNIFSWEDTFVNYKNLEKTDIFPPAIIRFRVFGSGPYYTTNGYELYTDGGSFTLATGGEGEDTYINGVKFNYNSFVDVDMRNWSLSKRTIAYSNYTGPEGDGIGVWSSLSWEALPSLYSITFEENGGTEQTDLTEQTALPSPLPTTTKANHVFAGWYYDNLFTQKANAGDELTADVTLYAKWYTPTTWCEDIADAIREKDGTTELIKHLDFPDRIRALESGVDVSDANAVVGEVLAGKTFYAVDDTKKTGTMPNRGTVSTDITTKAQEVTIQQGYHSGSGKVKISTTEQAKIIASNIKSGVTILGQVGAVTPAKEEETKTVTPNFSSGNVVVTPTSGKVITQVTINKDSNLIAGNIKKDVTIHGITGTFEGAGGGPYSVTLNRYGSGDLYYKKDNDNWTELTTSTVVNNVNSLISIGRGSRSMYASLEISDSVYIISSFYEDYTHIITLSNSVGLGYTYDIMLKTIVVNKNLVINISVSD